MRIGLRILLGYFVIVAMAAILLGRVFVQEVKPGVRQTMEDTLVDTANLLAELATDDLLAGKIDHGRFAESVRALTDRDPGAEIWGFAKRRSATASTSPTSAASSCSTPPAATSAGTTHAGTTST